jgi:hypothetical protein
MVALNQLNEAVDDKKEALKQEVNQLKTALDESFTTFQKEMDVKSNSLK